MVSTFHGLETAKRGMFTQQSALSVTGHNIANANTPGYSRQRLNFQQTEPYPAPALNRPQIPGQIGTGVEAGSIQRVRDSFLDIQYRNEHNKLGYWETKANALMQMEEVMNEPSDTGLAKTMDMFWQSLQDLATNPRNPGARSVVRERGIALADTFQYLSNSLSDIRTDLGNEIDVTEKEVNSLLEQIDSVNNQIAAVEPHGYLPNDLYDERDRLIDNLSQLVNVKVSYQPAGGNVKSGAEGKAVIDLVGQNNSQIANLINSQGFQKIQVNYTSASEESYVTGISIGENDIPMENFKSDGKLKGLIESYGMKKISNTLPGASPASQSDIVDEQDDINALLSQIHNMNNETADGPLSAEDNTKRDDLIKDLKDFVNIKVSYQPADDNTASNAEKKAIIHLVDENNSLTANLVNADAFQEVEVNFTAPGSNSYVTGISVGGIDIPIEDFKSDGSLKGLIESYGMQSEVVSGDYPEMLEELDNLAFTFAVEFNKVHFAGMSPNEINSTTNDNIRFFQDSEFGNLLEVYGTDVVQLESLRKGFAQRMEISDKIRESLDNIANADGENPEEATTGDATILHALADLVNEEFNYANGEDSEKASFRNYYEVLIGGMAVDTQNAVRLTQNSGTLRQAVEERRMSTSAVSLDEEMTNMIQFQHAYNASARMITLQDELLDKIINGMGTGGR
jgi:flagellar hook-associated protein 1